MGKLIDFSNIEQLLNEPEQYYQKSEKIGTSSTRWTKRSLLDLLEMITTTRKYVEKYKRILYIYQTEIERHADEYMQMNFTVLWKMFEKCFFLT